MAVNKDLVLGFVFYKDDKTFALLEMPEGHPVGCKKNGFGGKIEEGETPRDAFKREAFEEVNLAMYAEDINFIGSAEVSSDYFGTVTLHVGIYDVEQFRPSLHGGEFKCKPEWVAIEDFPWDDLPEGNREWLERPLWDYAYGSDPEKTFRAQGEEG